MCIIALHPAIQSHWSGARARMLHPIHIRCVCVCARTLRLAGYISADCCCCQNGIRAGHQSPLRKCREWNRHEFSLRGKCNNTKLQYFPHPDSLFNENAPKPFHSHEWEYVLTRYDAYENRIESRKWFRFPYGPTQSKWINCARWPWRNGYLF